MTWGAATSIRWVEARDAVNPATRHRSFPARKNYPGQSQLLLLRNPGLEQKKLQRASPAATCLPGNLRLRNPCSGIPGYKPTLAPLSTSGDSRKSSAQSPQSSSQDQKALPSPVPKQCLLVSQRPQGTRPRRKNQKAPQAPTHGPGQAKLELSVVLLRPQSQPGWA